MISDSVMGASVYIVDDNKGFVESLIAILSGEGFRNLEGYTESSPALERILTDPCDLLILDLHMPDLNGIEFFIELRKSISLEDMFPVLILTGDSDPSLRDTALAMGTMDYLTKPFRKTEVLLRVRNLLRMWMLHVQVRHNASLLEDKVLRRTRELHHAQLETVRHLAQAAEFRDDNTGRHIQRVGRMAGMIASRIMSDATLAGLMMPAAQLHDLGKIGIRDSILLKEGKLTPEEYEEVKTHTLIGERILHRSASRLLQLASEIVLSHHERWDGAGYPHGKSGSDIPLSGRITSVADVHDALTHERPYKPAWSHGDAVAEIHRQRGAMFDPDVVDVFTALVDAGFGIESIVEEADQSDD